MATTLHNNGRSIKMGFALWLVCAASLVHVTVGGADTTPPDQCPGSEIVGGLVWFKENPDTFEVRVVLCAPP